MSEEVVAPPEPGEWNEVIRNWWQDRQQEREPPPDDAPPMPRPYLEIDGDMTQINAFGQDEPGTLTLTVWNSGSGPAWTCCVELYEGPGGIASPLSAYELRGGTITTLQPGQRRDVTVPWVRRRPYTKDLENRVVAICYDPLLDPVTDSVTIGHPADDRHIHRHITSIHY